MGCCFCCYLCWWCWISGVVSWYFVVCCVMIVWLCVWFWYLFVLFCLRFYIWYWSYIVGVIWCCFCEFVCLLFMCCWVLVVWIWWWFCNCWIYCDGIWFFCVYGVFYMCLMLLLCKCVLCNCFFGEWGWNGIVVDLLNMGCYFVRDVVIKIYIGCIWMLESKKFGLMNWVFCLNLLGWLMGFEFMMIGIIILDFINWVIVIIDIVCFVLLFCFSSEE